MPAASLRRRRRPVYQQAVACSSTCLPCVARRGRLPRRRPRRSSASACQSTLSPWRAAALPLPPMCLSSPWSLAAPRWTTSTHSGLRPLRLLLPLPPAAATVCEATPGQRSDPFYRTRRAPETQLLLVGAGSLRLGDESCHCTCRMGRRILLEKDWRLLATQSDRRLGRPMEERRRFLSRRLLHPLQLGHSWRK